MLVPVQIFVLVAILQRTPASRSQIGWPHIRSRSNARLWIGIYCIFLGIQLQQGFLLARFGAQFVWIYWRWSLGLQGPWWLWSITFTSGMLLLGLYAVVLAWGIFVVAMLCCAAVELVKLPDVVETAQGLAIK
jgi:hypothetical protein